MYNKNFSYWLNKFLSVRELTKPTGKPLYTYRTTDEEFSQLRELLSLSLIVAKGSPDRILSALFCLYGAEWYRREYQGEWSWRGIEQSLGIKLEQNIRIILLKKGFSYWERNFFYYDNNHHSYLGSVYREGGLPYKLLISEDNRFQELFRKILYFYSQNPQIILDPLSLLPKLIYFPEALKTETTLSLITDMVANLANLVNKYNLSYYSSPADYLDEHNPDWKNDFPIPLNNDYANKLLLNLLDTAIKTNKKEAKSTERYTIRQTLVNPELFKFNVEITLAKILIINKKQSNINKTRCVLKLYEGNDLLISISPAYIVSETNDSFSISLRTTHTQSYRKNIKYPLYLVLEQQGAIVYREMLPSSEINVTEMPLILNENILPKVIGSGSVSIKAKTLHLVTTENATIQLKDEHSELIEELNSNGLKHYLLSGQVIIQYENETFYISSRNEKLREQIKLIGSTLPYFTSNGYPIYLGSPRIIKKDDEFHLSISFNNKFKYARILDKSGNLIFKQKIFILPKDLKIRFHKSESPKEGVIDIFSSENFSINPINIPEIETEIVRNVQGYGKHLLVKNVSGKFISKIPLSLSFYQHPDVEIILPFPSSGVQILDSENKEVSVYRSLSLQELLGSYLIFYPDINIITNYSIDLKNSKNNNYFFQYTLQDNPLEISLNEFKSEILSLFSISKNLDEQVKLIVSQNNREIRQLTLTLYATDLIVNDNYIEMNDLSENIELDLLSLVSLECRKLNKLEDGRFLLPDEINFPSLIISQPSSKLQSRAVFVPSTIQSEISGELQIAISSPPDSYSKNVQIVLNKMAKDFNHQGWEYLNVLYQKFSYLPLSTFFIWKELVRNNNALVAFVLNPKTMESVMEHFQNELNVSWNLIPEKIWQEQLDVLSSSLQSSLDLNHFPDISIFIERIINNQLDKVKRFALILDNKEESISVEIARYVISFWFQDLQNKNINRYWIDDFGTELADWGNEQGIELNIKFKSYQQAVIFFPFFAAAVTCGKASLDSLRPMEEKDFYTFKMLMEFDFDWFNSVYLYAIQLFKNKE